MGMKNSTDCYSRFQDAGFFSLECRGVGNEISPSVAESEAFAGKAVGKAQCDSDGAVVLDEADTDLDDDAVPTDTDRQAAG